MISRRWVLGAITGAGALGAALLVAAPQPDASPQRAAAVPQAVASPEADLSSKLVRDPLAAGMHGDPFALQRTTPAAAPVKQMRQPPMTETAVTPPMPAFPYKFAGRLDRRDAKGELYLTKGSELVPIAEGQVLDAAWRINAIGADRLQVTYLPRGQTTSLLFSTLVGEPAASAPAMVADVQPSETSSGIIGGASDVQPSRTAAAGPGGPAYAAGAV